MQKRRIFGALSVAAMAIGLTACQEETAPPPEPAETAQPAAEADGPDAAPGIEVSDARLILPVVASGPAAVYFTIKNGNDKPITIASVHVEGAENTQMHETAEGTMTTIEQATLGAGETGAFTPGGKHVMVFGLEGGKSPGDVAEMTLTLSDGDKISVPVTIEARSQGGGDMPGMNTGAES